ncbi:MAG: hypothetical protein J6S73_07830 [Lentisphaeria bacterium]|nr:hypothetical protein [Lentisphaeria bacterium]
MKILLLQICFLLPFLLGAADLRDLLNVPAETFWERDAAALQKSAGVPFASGTKDRKSIRYPVKKKQTTGKLLWLDQPVCEVVCSLTSPGGKLQAMEISIYNRGDAGGMPERDFKRLREQTELEIGKLSGSSTPPERDRMRMARETVFSRTWQGNGVRWQLLWCESDRGPEYLTLKVLHPSLPVEKLRKAVQAAADKKKLPERVVKNPDGSLHLPIPMIDQGDKGYCAAATVARVIRYYGGDVDQNQLAQIIGTDARFGTSVRELLKKLEREKQMLNVRTRMLYEFQEFNSINDIRKFVSRYNRAARSAKRKSIRIEDHIRTSGRQRILDLNSLNREIDQEVYREMRLKDKDLPKFRREVENALRRGLPVLWMIPGHIRLIVGIDPKQDQLFYSDSWGSGHEMKKMPVKEAFVLTHRIFVLEPR